jgi:hypothetical protein
MLGGITTLMGSRRGDAEVWETGMTAARVLEAPEWPASFPLLERHLKRLDESPDTRFYSQPRVNVQHIDEYAVKAISKHYADVLPKGGAVLDLMSSWTSHLAPGHGRDKAEGYFSRASAVGMHDAELKSNPALHDFHVHDLNASPRMPFYADSSFDAVFCSVSVDYLADPLPIFAEIHRVLKPGGLAVFTWSKYRRALEAPTLAAAATRAKSQLGQCDALPCSVVCSRRRPSPRGARLPSQRACGSAARTSTLLEASRRRRASISLHTRGDPTPCTL